MDAAGVSPPRAGVTGAPGVPGAGVDRDDAPGVATAAETTGTGARRLS